MTRNIETQIATLRASHGALSTLVLAQLAALDLLVPGSARETLGFLRGQIAAANQAGDREAAFELMRLVEQVEAFLDR